MTACAHPVQFLQHTVECTPLPKTHAEYRERHRTVCTKCMCVIRDRVCESFSLPTEWSDSK